MQSNSLPVPISDDLAKHAKAVWQRMPLYYCQEDLEVEKRSFVRLFAEIKPRDLLEEDWVIDIADCTRSISRLRNVKEHLSNASMYLGLRRILAPLIGATDALALASDWNESNVAAVKEVEEILASADLTMDVVIAETFALRLPEIERIERMIADAMANRSAILREIERHRAALARQVRQTIDQVEDVEFKDLIDGPDAKKAS